MFGMGFWEICLILLIALIVLGPKRLPVVAKSIGQWVSKFRTMVGNVQQELERDQESSVQDKQTSDTDNNKPC